MAEIFELFLDLYQPLSFSVCLLEGNIQIIRDLGVLLINPPRVLFVLNAGLLVLADRYHQSPDFLFQVCLLGLFGEHLPL